MWQPFLVCHARGLAAVVLKIVGGVIGYVFESDGGLLISVYVYMAVVVNGEDANLVGQTYSLASLSGKRRGRTRSYPLRTSGAKPRLAIK